MGSELRTERVEGHEGAEIGDVRLRIECRVGELGRVEPERVRVVDRVAEQVGGGSGQRRVHLRRHRFAIFLLFGYCIEIFSYSICIAPSFLPALTLSTLHSFRVKSFGQ